ncbi:DUF1328 domain-containing protein [Christiangramia portivictoriae]|uniref:DUF1328 domain-containing protein n=2 Tax=Christiangramia TaxID=292691 RepID=UPI001FDF7256|nr:DUF1328 domain-containing protein [Christiangramia portivictoriae]
MTNQPESYLNLYQTKQVKSIMRKKALLFLVLAAVTGLVGFTGLSFSGIEVVRIMFLIFADLLVISLMAKLFFPEKPKMKYQPVKRR